MAMVQGAVFDAVNSIEGGYESYLDVPSAPPGASVDAAVATAAKRVLKKMIPLVAPLTDPAIRDAILSGIQTQFETELATIPAGIAKRQGRQAGRAAATAMLEDRMGDGRYPSTPFMFTEGTGVGEWRPTNGVSDPFAWVANVRPFTLKSTSQFRTDGPLAVTSDEYAEEYAEVQALGAATDSTRTPEQTALATFYLPSPIEMFNRTFRTISVSTSLDVADQARLFSWYPTCQNGPCCLKPSALVYTTPWHPHVLDIQHIGSTSVPGLSAKPILDLGIAVADESIVTVCVPRITALGYMYRGVSRSRPGTFLRPRPRTPAHALSAYAADQRSGLVELPAISRSLARPSSGPRCLPAAQTGSGDRVCCRSGGLQRRESDVYRRNPCPCAHWECVDTVAITATRRCSTIGVAAHPRWTDIGLPQTADL